MALSSDEIVKREIIETLGPTYRDLKLRIFPEGSNDDQRLFTEGGLTFSKDGVDYGSCDAGWFYKQDGKIIPFIGLEGTDALNRGSSGNAQYQRFHHALGAVKNGLIGVYYLKRGVDSIRPDLYRMAVSASEHEAGVYLIIDDLKDLRPIIENYDNPIMCQKAVSRIIDKMRNIADADFRKTYKGSWEVFANKRSTIFLDGDIVVKYAGRMIRNFTESSQRAGHIAVGEMYLSKYFFYGKKIFYLMPKMTAEDIAYLDKYKRHDKEWHLLRNEPNVEMKSIDDLDGVPAGIYNTLMSIRLKPLKGETMSIFNECVEGIKNGLKRGTITFKTCGMKSLRLVKVEDDQEVRNLIFERLHIDNTISNMQLQREVINVFGERYPGMSLNDWRHIIEDYTPMIRKASKAREIPLVFDMAAEPEDDS